MEDIKLNKLKELIEYIIKFELTANVSQLQLLNYTSNSDFLVKKIIDILTEEQKQSLLEIVINWKINEINLTNSNQIALVDQLNNQITELENLLEE
jgi:hypothetical protein